MPSALHTLANAQRARGIVASIGLFGLLALLSGCGQTLEITPTQAQAPAGTTLQLTASTLHALVATDVTSQVSWWSSDSAVATVSSGGVVSAASPGSVTIWASLSGSTATMSLTVTAGTLVSIEVTPANPSLPNGLTEQFTATGVFSDNSTQDVTQLVTWASASPAVASVSNNAGTAGLASAASTGSTTVTATSGSISGSTTLTVTSATLASIQVTPANPSTPKGVSQQFTATGIFSDNSTQNLTAQVTWASSTPAVATISNAAGSQGLASSAAVGSTTISAASGAISGSTTLTVSSATLVSIAVTPATPSIANGLTEQFTATGTYTDNSTQNLTTQVTWASSNTSAATVSNAAGSQGLASSAAVGSTTISAASGAISGSTTLTVTSATLVSIAVTPATPSIANGLTEQFTATGTYTDNSTQNLTTQVTWASSNPSVATISNAAGSQGLASSAAVGSTTISAASAAISGSTTLTVTSATLVSIAVTPATPSIANGLTEQFTATGTYTDTSTQNLTTQVTWASSNTAVATISNAAGSQGLASSASPGDTSISATSGLISGSTGLTVTTCANGFSNCEVVTIDHTQVGNSDSSNFPMLFSGTYAYLASAANGGSVQNTVTQQGITAPADAVFTSDSGCTSPLNWEVQSYDPTAGAVNIWVQIPTLSHTVDTVIYLCVGNSSVSSFQGGALGAAWNSNYVGVWHLSNGTTLSVNDSTSNANNGTNMGATATTGQIGGAASFSGGNEAITTNLLVNSNTFTRILWVNQSALQDVPLIGNDNGDYQGSALWLNDFGAVYVHNCYPVASCDDVVSANGAVTAGAWNFVAVSVNAGAATFYINGSSSTPAGEVDQYGTTIDFACNPYSCGGGDFNGALDEIEISNVALSADWITAEYNNQSSPATFYAVAN